MWLASQRRLTVEVTGGDPFMIDMAPLLTGKVKENDM